MESPSFPKREFDEEDHPFIHVINTDSASAVCQAPQGLKERNTHTHTRMKIH